MAKFWQKKAPFPKLERVLKVNSDTSRFSFETRKKTQHRRESFDAGSDEKIPYQLEGNVVGALGGAVFEAWRSAEGIAVP